MLASSAHFRPEAMRRVKTTREEELKKLRKIGEDERADERRVKAEKDKKDEREKRLRAMTSDEQKKFTERERQLELRRGQKKRSMKA